jgi:exo-beta-1,3-glucanase (GH17 family)
MIKEFRLRFLSLAIVLLVGSCLSADDDFTLFRYLRSEPTPHLITYTPSQLDPRNPANQAALKTNSIRADLEALRPAFDGLVLYGYHEACTPRILAVAKELKFKAVLLGIWDIKSAAEIDGVSKLVDLHHADFALGVIVGNEGITFSRYEADDLAIAAVRLRASLPRDVAITTSEPLVGYQHEFIREFGDFLAPNIHPVFDRENLGPADAAAWERQEAGKLADRSKKPVLVKETGFPHAGKPRYTPQSQQEFWAAYTKPGLLEDKSQKTWQFFGVGFEAFDLPWKSEESKLEIEKSWGLFSPKREPYPAATVWSREAKK